MEKIVNYNSRMHKTIGALEQKEKPQLLLHSCCAPCSTSVIEKLEKHFSLTIFYFNPNIFPTEEFEKRKTEEIKYLNILEKLGKTIKFIEKNENYNSFLEIIKGNELEAEGGKRCYLCIKYRMEETAKYAKENNFDFFCSTLSVSPHKNANWINQFGEELEKKYGVKFLPSDFKKENGYLRSIQLSKENGLYRQDYCGCQFSIQKNVS